jgi:phage terminase Nu1 subunit (DNA packaging protein)
MIKLFNKVLNRDEIKVETTTEWNFYSKIIKELELSREPLSDDSGYFVCNYKNLTFKRFVCLSGEKIETECQLVIDLETGNLYTPKWFNEQVKQRMWFRSDGEKAINSLKNIFVKEIKNWKAEEYSKLSQLKKNGFLDWIAFDDYFTGWNNKIVYRYKNNKDYIALPVSTVFVSENIWGDNFSKEKFIDFVKRNNFLVRVDMEFKKSVSQIPEFETIPTLLKNLKDKTGIELHTDKIVFPNALFHSSSLITKYSNFVSFIDFLLLKIDTFSEKHSQQLKERSEIYKIVSNLKGTTYELQNLQELLLSKTGQSFQPLQKILDQYHSEISEELDNLENKTVQFFQNEKNSIFDFMPHMQDFDFDLIGENLTRMYNLQVDKIISMSDNLDSLFEISKTIESFFIDSEEFRNEKKEALRIKCEKEYVLDKFTAIYGEWNLEIENIETLYTPVLREFFNKVISEDLTLYIFTLFESLRKYTDDFFQHDRILLIQKYDGYRNSDFLQKAEIETRLFKHYRDVRNGLKNAVANEEQMKSKRFLNNQAQMFFARELENIINFLELAGVSENLRKEFKDLEKRDLDLYLPDFNRYEEEFDKRDKALQSLIFRMKKDLEQKQQLGSSKAPLIDI